MKRALWIALAALMLLSPALAEAVFSDETLELAFAEAEALAETWNDTPGYASGAYIRMGGISYSRNRVELTLGGRNAPGLARALLDSAHAACYHLTWLDLDASESLPVPRPPQSALRANGYALEMEQPEYPARAERISFALRTDDGRLMDYILQCALYKWTGADFEAVPMDFQLPVPGTAVGETRIEFDLGCVRPLGEGLYRLDTGLGALEFAVTADAPPPQAPPAAEHPAIEIPAHALSGADPLRYNSCPDPCRAGDRLLIGERLYWLHAADPGNVEIDDRVYSILTAPADAPQDVSRIYGPTALSLSALTDAGNGILFIEATETPDERRYALQKLAYDGSAVERIAVRSSPVWNARLIGGLLYYCDRGAVYRFDFADHSERVVFSTPHDIEWGFECAGGRLLVSVTNWNDYSGGGIYAVDLQTLKSERLIAGRTCYLMASDEAVYTLLCREEPHVNIAIHADGGVERISKENYQYVQLTPDGLIVDIWNAESWRDGSWLNRYALLRRDGTRADNLPKGLFFLGGRYWVEDGDGNLRLFDALP